MELTFSDFLRHSGQVLERLSEQDVVLRRRDAEDLQLTTTRRSQAFRDGLALLSAVLLEALRDEKTRSAVARSAPAGAPWTSSLSASERAHLLAEISRTAAAGAELGIGEPLAEVLDRWRQAARLRAKSPPRSAHETRPVAIPEDVDDPSVEKAKGIVELPLRVRWSGPRRTYDLSDPKQLKLVYEQVLQEGTDEDVRRFIDIDTLIEHWSHLVLPHRVKDAWARWLRTHRDVEVAC